SAARAALALLLALASRHFTASQYPRHRASASASSRTKSFSSIWICIVHSQRCSSRLPDLVLVQPSIPVQPRLRARDEFPAFSEPLRIAAHSRPEVLQDLVSLGVESLSGPRPLCSGSAHPPRVQGPEFVEAIRSALARVFFSVLFCICSVLYLVRF